MPGQNREKIGELLVRIGMINGEQLAEALEAQGRDGGKLGEVLMRELALTEDQLAEALAEKEGMRYVNLHRIEIDRAAVSLMPVKTAQRRGVIPIGFEDGRIILAMADPLDVQAIDEAQLHSQRPVEPVVAPASQVRYAIEKFAVGGAAFDALEREGLRSKDKSELSPTSVVDTDGPVVRTINQLLRGAIADQASDLHLEPEETCIKVRYRVSGVMTEVATLPKESQQELVSRLKVMADMDIIERRRPQDGRIALRADGKTVDMRISMLPTPWGESVVVRVLDSEMAFRPVEEIGLSPANIKTLESMVSKPYGAILVAGPTGSGKTTTLYGALNRINQSTRKIITIEDPLEYRLPGVTQVAVNSKIGLTFAAGLRQILRSDPDVVMVGEVRDTETASIAVRAAMTGHLVLSSIHTNDAPSVVTRLADMGVEPFITSSAVIGAIAQRLVRVLCPQCKRQANVSHELLVAAGFSSSEAEHVQVFEPIGCDACRDTGYKGRIGIFEIMEIDADIMELIISKAPAATVRALAIQKGMRPLRRDALDKIAAGVTTLAELVRVVA